MNSTDLKQIDELIQKRLENVATKDDLKQELKDYPTRKDIRDELKGFATKDDLKNFATKDDLKQFATKDDLRNFATKNILRNEINVLKKDLEDKMDEIAAIIISSVNNSKADKEDLDSLAQRVAIIEDKLTSSS